MPAPDLPDDRARAAAEWAARASYGKLVAQLTARLGDVSLAEDSLADAFASALATWPVRGVPETPEAWLMTAARRKAVDMARKAGTATRHVRAALPLLKEADMTLPEDTRRGEGDRRLELMFLCAHPAIPAAAHTALMLQAVLGFTAEEIAAATLESPDAVGQRLARAKRRLGGGDIPFALPPDHILRDRMAAVLRAIYAAYTSGWDHLPGGADPVTGLAAEADWLARCLVRLAPEDAEAKGLLALILYCESRRAARRDGAGQYVPLDRQDTSLWDEDRIREATALLTEAEALRSPGRFQLEAAIQAVHAARRQTGRTDWRLICQLYGVLREVAPSAGAQIGEAAARLQAGEAETALALLDALPEKQTQAHAPYWAARAHVLQAMGRVEETRAAFGQAAALTPDAAARDWLLAQRLDLQGLIGDGQRDRTELLRPVLIGKLLGPVHPGEGDLHVTVMNHEAGLKVAGEGAAVFDPRRVPPEVSIKEHVPRDGPAVDADKGISAPRGFIRSGNELPRPGQRRPDARRTEAGIEIPADPGRQSGIRIGTHIAEGEARMTGKVRLETERQVEFVEPLQALGDDLDARLVLQLVIPALRAGNAQHLVPVVLDKLPPGRRADNAEIDLQRVLHALLHIGGDDRRGKGEPAGIGPVLRVRVCQGDVFGREDRVRQAEALPQVRPLHFQPGQPGGHPFQAWVYLVGGRHMLEAHAVRIIPVRAGAEHVVLGGERPDARLPGGDRSGLVLFVRRCRQAGCSTEGRANEKGRCNPRGPCPSRCSKSGQFHDPSDIT